MGMFTLQWKKITKIFRIFGNVCSLFTGYRGVLKQMDPNSYSASSTMWEYRNWTWQICLEKSP